MHHGLSNFDKICISLRMGRYLVWGRSGGAMVLGKLPVPGVVVGWCEGAG